VAKDDAINNMCSDNLCNAIISQFSIYRKHVGEKPHVWKFSTCFHEAIDKNTTQKDEKVENCEFVQKYICTYARYAWVLVNFVSVWTCVCECSVCVDVAVRFVSSFVFSVLSVDCWRPWQQLTWLMRRRIVVLKCVLVARRFSPSIAIKHIHRYVCMNFNTYASH